MFQIEVTTLRMDEKNVVEVAIDIADEAANAPIQMPMAAYVTLPRVMGQSMEDYEAKALRDLARYFDRLTKQLKKKPPKR